MTHVPVVRLAIIFALFSSAAHAACPGLDGLKLPIVWTGTPDLAPAFCDKPTWRFVAYGVFKGSDGRFSGLVDEFKRLDRVEDQKAFLREASAAVDLVNARTAEVRLALSKAQAAQQELESLRTKPDADRSRVRELMRSLITREGEPLGAIRTPNDAQGGPLLEDIDVRLIRFARGLQHLPFDAGIVKGTVGFYSSDPLMQTAGRLDEPMLRSLWEGEGRTESAKSSCGMAQPNGRSYGGGPLDRVDDRAGMDVCGIYFDSRELLNRVNENVRNAQPPFNTVAAILAELGKPGQIESRPGVTPARKEPVPLPPSARTQSPTAPGSSPARTGKVRPAPPAPVPAPNREAQTRSFETAFDRTMRARLGEQLDRSIMDAQADPAGRARAATLRALKARAGDFRVTRSRVIENGKEVDRVDYTLVDVRDGRATYTTLASADVPEPRRVSPAAIEGDERARTALLNVFHNRASVDELVRRFRPVVGR